MSNDLLEQLAAAEVPAPPADLDREVHRRVNHSLLLLHLAELFFRALPYAIAHLAAGLLGLLSYSFTGGRRADGGDRPATPP
jgi:hypothetical protein